MSFFSNRELSVLIFSTLFFIFLIRKPDVRSSLGKVVKCVFSAQLSIIWISGLLSIAVGVWCLELVNIWEVDHLKDTVIWSFSAGLILIFHGVSLNGEKPNYKKVVKDLFKLIIVLEVLLSAYNFNIIVELILLLLILLFSLILGVSEQKEEYAPAKKISEVILFVTLGIMMTGSIRGFVIDPEALVNWHTLKSMLIPVYLTIWLIPVSYLIGLKAAYEQLFLQLKSGTQRGFKFYWMSRLCVFQNYGLNLGEVIDARRYFARVVYSNMTLSELRTTLKFRAK